MHEGDWEKGIILNKGAHWIRQLRDASICFTGYREIEDTV